MLLTKRNNFRNNFFKVIIVISLFAQVTFCNMLLALKAKCRVGVARAGGRKSCANRELHKAVPESQAIIFLQYRASGRTRTELTEREGARMNERNADKAYQTSSE